VGSVASYLASYPEMLHVSYGAVAREFESYRKLLKAAAGPGNMVGGRILGCVLHDQSRLLRCAKAAAADRLRGAEFTRVMQY
jgi:hypothetical protein